MTSQVSYQPNSTCMLHTKLQEIGLHKTPDPLEARIHIFVLCLFSVYGEALAGHIHIPETEAHKLSCVNKTWCKATMYGYLGFHYARQR